MKRRHKRLNFKNVPTAVPLLFLACTRMCINTCTETSQRMRKKKASTRTPFVVKQRKDTMTDLEKCCMTTQLIQPLHSQARRPLGRYHSRKKTNFPFGFSGVDDSWETSGHNRGAAAEADTIGKQQLKWTQSRSSSLSTQSCLYDFTIASWMLLLLMCVPVRQFMDREDMPITVAINVDLGILVKCRCHMETSTITNLVAISIHITAPLTGTPLLEIYCHSQA